jgi:PadR family transcriptional regulator, regulatory protein AphA
MATAVTPVILGFLSFGPRSGYEIKAAVDRSTRFFWAASYGQIYPELRRLEREGLIEGEDAPSGRRARRVYRLTPAGRDELLAWFSEPIEKVEVRDENLLRLFFADVLPRDQALELLEGRRRFHEEILAALLALDVPPGANPPFVDLVLRWGIDFNDWGAKWCKAQIERLSAETAKTA